MPQQPSSGLGRLIVEGPRSHTHTHTHPVGLLWTSDQLVSEAATCTTHNTPNRRTSMPSSGSEHSIPAIEWLLTYASDHTAIGIGLCDIFRNLQNKTCSISTKVSTNESNSLFIYKWLLSIANSNGLPLKRPFVFGKTFPATFDTNLRVRKRSGLHFYSAKSLCESGAFRSLSHYIFIFISTFAAFRKRQVMVLPITSSIASWHAYMLTSVLNIIIVNTYWWPSRPKHIVFNIK